MRKFSSLENTSLIDTAISLPLEQRAQYLHSNNFHSWTDRDGRTILHAIVERSHAHPLISSLTKIGVGVDKEDDNATTPLALASQLGNVNAVRALLEEGANVNSLNMNESTPLHLAVASHRVEVIPVLIAAGANLYAVNRRGTPVISGVFKSLYPHVAGNEHFPLLAMEQLLNAGISIESKNGDGRTLLHMAELFGTIDQFSRLIELGADLNAKDYKGCTALYLTTLGENKINRALMLIGAGADLEIKAHDRLTAHQYAKKIQNDKWISDVDAFISSRSAHQVMDEILKNASRISPAP